MGLCSMYSWTDEDQSSYSGVLACLLAGADVGQIC